MQKEYYAKSKLNDGRRPTVKEHLAEVSTLAECFGMELGMETEARLAGLLHDFGKYSPAFQEVLCGRRHGVDHALPGAELLYQMYHKKSQKLGVVSVVEAVNGHHDGLMSFGALQSFFEANDSQAVCCNGGKTASISGPFGGDAFRTAVAALMQDFPDFRLPKLAAPEVTENTELCAYNLETMLHTRLLFSCLVDADYSVSASDEDPEYLQKTAPEKLDPQDALNRLLAYRNQIRQESKAEGAVNQIREALFVRCGCMGDAPEGLYTLTAPTGTGKTLALLHFALRHCIAAQKKRIILVLPFLTLTEQTADTYREIFPSVLEDHSQSELDDMQREYAARWSAPVIITTTVKFFESLFASRPTDCRKLHHLANSVVLFDEAQSLPPELTISTLRAVNCLCRQYHVTTVFSTATQPCFDALPELAWRPTEINPEPAGMYEALRRVRVDWRLTVPTPLESIAAEMATKENACAIVNLRRHASKLFTLLKNRCDPEGLFLITTDLCAAHRSRIIQTIKNRRKKNLPCRVVATQCIEAGVDLDFSNLYRALAPLESIIQAAGRCNRNGKQPGGGKFMVFVPDEEGCLYPGDWYELAAITVKSMAREGEIDIHSPRQIEEYYRRLFKNHKEKHALEEAIKNRDYAGADVQYRLIEERGVQVIVPYTEKIADYRAIQAEAKNGVTPGLLKRAAGITVTVPYGKQEVLLEEYAERLPYRLRRHISGEPDALSNVFLLFPQYEAYYTSDMGLHFPDKEDKEFFW